MLITNGCKISRVEKSKEQSGLCDIKTHAFEASLHTLLEFKTVTSEGFLPLVPEDSCVHTGYVD